MLKVHTKNLGSVAILCLQGRIVNGETEALRRAVDFQSDAGAVVLDLARVNTIDAGGLGVMLELRQQTKSRGIGFKLMNVPKLVSRVLEITRLNSVFQITTRVELLSSVSSGKSVAPANLGPDCFQQPVHAVP